ncbi:MAG: hypothetical protein Q9157_008290 [Trypethelium eluteriae]
MDYLTKANPNLEVHPIYDKTYQGKPFPSDGLKSGGSTRNDKYPKTETWSVWEEFNLENVRKLFDERLSATLQRDFDLQDFSQIHPYFYRISDEDSFQSFVIKYNQSVVLEALDKTAHELLRQEVVMVRGGQAKVLFYPKWNPDWGGRSHSRGTTNILPGETKSSRVFNSRTLMDNIQEEGGVEEPETDYLWPVRQLLAYCVDGHMRYGYIITNEELMVVRVGTRKPRDVNASQKELRKIIARNPFVEWQFIPWKHDNKNDVLTVNLALWVLHLLAANNGLLDWEYASLKEERLLNEPSLQPQLHYDETSRTPALQPESQQSVQPTTSFEESQSHADSQQNSRTYSSPEYDSGDIPLISQQPASQRSSESNTSQKSHQGRKRSAQHNPIGSRKNLRRK